MHSYTDNSTQFHSRSHGLGALIGRPRYETAYHPRQLGRLLSRTSQGLVHWLTTGSMPRVSKEMKGDTEFWRVYDPVSHSTRYFDHEDALRVWMEARYYQ
ncbi:hypothetical protein [Halomicronema sp. CCY15110]|uniref:hypothetical protein n=1 Tax=Halomicronema sp. CCY15110 TaxID=2767773 RepID=UPI00194FD0DF|nr:hypothetical protein [Halomicronema sp. CCY15110]